MLANGRDHNFEFIDRTRQDDGLSVIQAEYAFVIDRFDFLPSQNILFVRNAAIVNLYDVFLLRHPSEHHYYVKN